MSSTARGSRTSLSFEINVLGNAPNGAPVITSTPRTSIRLSSNYLYQIVASDPNNDPLQYTLDTSPAGMTVDGNGLVTWQPDSSQLGDHAVRLQANDGRGGSVVQDFIVRVVTIDTNQSPAITSNPPRAATVGHAYVYNLTGDDPEGDPLIWTLDKRPRACRSSPLAEASAGRRPPTRLAHTR